MPNSEEEAGATIEPAPVVVWLHGDHLSAQNPALARYPDAPVVFVFDRHFLHEAQFAFHRLFFLYESVLDVFASRGKPDQCQIRLGVVIEEVRAFARERSAQTIATTETLGERFAEYKTELGRDFRVEALPVPQLVASDPARTPRRFSVWWRGIEEDALR